MIGLLEGSRTVGPHGIDAIALVLIVLCIICDLASSCLCCGLRLTDFPTQCTVLVSARTNNIVKIITMEYVFDLSDPYEYRIEKALDLLNRELEPNYDAMSRRAGLVRTTLSRRFRGVTTSRTEVNSEHR